MNVIVSVECLKTQMRKKNKNNTFFYGRTLLPKNWIKSCSYRHCKSLPSPLCWSGTLDFLGSNRRPLEITFRFPSHPSSDLFKRLPQRTDCGTLSPFKPHHFHIHVFTRLQHFSKAKSKPDFFFFLMDKSPQKVPPTPTLPKTKKNKLRQKY